MSNIFKFKIKYHYNIIPIQLQLHNKINMAFNKIILCWNETFINFKFRFFKFCHSVGSKFSRKKFVLWRPRPREFKPCCPPLNSTLTKFHNEVLTYLIVSFMSSPILGITVIFSEPTRLPFYVSFSCTFIIETPVYDLI